MFRNVRGFGLADLLMGVSLTSALFVAGIGTLRPIVQSSTELSIREQIDSSLGEVGHFIKTIGRTAGGCTKQNSALVCILNPWTAHNQTNQVVQVQFIMTNNGLEFQRATGPNLWRTERTTPEVTEFTLCDADDMRGVNSSCLILPDNLSLAFAAQGVTAPNSFFRFRVIAERRFANARQVRKEYQSSFSIRNGGALTYE